MSPIFATMTGSRCNNRSGKLSHGIEIIPHASTQSHKNPNYSLGLSQEEFSLADVAAKMPLKVPALPENPRLARRFAPMGNTFLNWAGCDEGAIADADEADVIDTWELQSMNPWRHTFDIGQFGASELASRQNLESRNFERTFPSWGDLGASRHGQIERLSFHSDSANQVDRMPFQHLDYAPDVSLERLDRSELPNEYLDYTSGQNFIDLGLDPRADDSLPTLERESCFAGYGKSSRRNSFHQSLDSRWTREEEDIDASCDQTLPWGFTLAPNEFEQANRVDVYTTFDSWQDYDEIDAKLPWREEQPMEFHPQRVLLNDRTQTPTSLVPVRVQLSDSLSFAPPQRLGANEPEVQRKILTPMMLPEEGQLVAQEKPITTLMIRNVPTWYTQEMLLNEWTNDGTYNLLYLPFCFRTKKNLAFAFVNFTFPEHAEAFRERWHKKGLQQHTSRKLLDVSVADVQGQFETLQKLTKHKSCRIRNAHYQPAIFVNDKRFTVEEYLATMGPETLSASTLV